MLEPDRQPQCDRYFLMRQGVHVSALKNIFLDPRAPSSRYWNAHARGRTWVFRQEAPSAMSKQIRARNASASDDQLKPYSCLICRQRKVKCDRRSPCVNCVKAGSSCSFVPPVRGKRKRTKPVPEGMHAKLQRYEGMLKEYGAKLNRQSDDDDDDDEEGSDVETPATSAAATNPSPFQVEDAGQPASTPVTNPKLVVKEGSSRYFEK